MHDGYRVVVVTPAGRRATLSILARWMWDCRCVVDEWRLWMNTSVASDRAYINDLEVRGNGYVKVEMPGSGVEKWWRDDDPYRVTYTIHPFFRNCVDQKTIYIRLDDDIVYVTVGDLAKLLRFRLANPSYSLVSGNVVNNAICSHIHQRMGLLDSSRGLAGYSCMDSVGWGSGEFAEHCHRSFSGSSRWWDFEGCWEMGLGERLSINCICWTGSDFASFGGRVGVFEEQWLTVDRPLETGRRVAICGDCVVAHYGFGVQRGHLDGTEVLDIYRDWAGGEGFRI